MNLKLNPDDLTLGDLEDFEDAVGVPFDQAVKPRFALDENGNKIFDAKGRPQMETRLSAKALVALVWIVLRKSNPGFTREDARNVRVSSLVIEGDSTADRGND